jgi:hypothetical protein
LLLIRALEPSCCICSIVLQVLLFVYNAAVCRTSSKVTVVVG